MLFEKWKKEIIYNLTTSLNNLLPNHSFKEVIEYSVLPPGKVFRPMLVYSVAHDLGGIDKNHGLYAQAIELHHTYTLIHDDLPAMDNDDTRRGRPSSHKKFNESQAILAGDALLNLSYELIAQLDAPYLKEILSYFSKYNGATGLILGQIIDLNNQQKSLQEILELHELKTGRLIQLSLIGPAIISNKEQYTVSLQKLGLAVGINFQLLDDMCELIEPINKHETEINPFLHFDRDQLFKIISTNNQLIINICDELKLSTTKKYLNSYLEKTKFKLIDNLESINKHMEVNQRSIQQLF